MTVADVTRMVVLAAVYFLAAKLGLSFAFVAPQVTPVWPPTGIALAALVVFGPRLWPSVTLGAFVANWTANEPALTAAGIATGNTLEALIGAALLRRLGFHPALDRLRDVVALIGAALASPLIAATIGVTSLCAGGLQPWTSFVSLWWLWWIGDAMGAIVMAPLLLVWVAPRPWFALSRQKLGEGAALLTTLAIVTMVAFTGAPGLGSERYPLHYAALPLIVYAALRLGQRGATLATFMTSAIAVWTTVRGWGPLAAGTPTERVVVLLFFLAMIAATGLLLTAAIRERDAAERRRAAGFEQLAESEQRLRLALEAGEMAVWDWDIATGVVRWSDNMPGIFGLTADDFPHRPSGLITLVHAEDRARVARTVNDALLRGRYELEFRAARADGEQWMATTGTVLHDDRGSPARMLGISRNVTERHRLEAELTRRAGELADADQRKDVFLAMLAHELRAPLAPITGALYLLRESLTDRDRALAIADRQVKQLARLVDDLLDVSRITKGKIELCREPVALADAVSRAVETTRAQIQAADQRLDIALPAEPIWLDADPARLAQILGNLLANAAKYTPPNGAIRLSAEAHGGDVMIHVRDNGPGIPADLLPHIFDVFVQGDTSLERARGGLGVGLTIVQQLVLQHGGRIEARTPESGAGSEFVVTLPIGARPPAQVVAMREPPARTSSNGKRSVLIVEDNRDTAESLARMLEVWGHRVRVATDGASALAVMDNGAPDVVLSDLGLPGMDGYELAKRIRRHPKGRDVLLIAVSGYGQAGDKARALEAGFDHHLVKPADLPRLAELLTASSQGE